jgi:hypothetical protein
MGLMDFLGLDTRDIQEFTRGFVGSRVEAMEAEANRKAGLKNEEDKLKLANKYSAQAYKDQLETEADFAVRKETIDRDKLKTDLLGLDMSVDFYNLIPSIYTANFDTYKGYVDSQHDGNFDWWRMPVEMPDGSMGTRESYTLAANQNFLNKKNLSSNLTSNDGALANQSNSADLLLEDKETTPQFADFSEFIAKPEQVKAQVDAIETDSDIQMQGDQSVQIPAFQGLGLDTDFIQQEVAFPPRKDIDKERTSKSMINNVATGGGFGDNVVFKDGEFVAFRMEGDITEKQRFNATTAIGQSFISATYQATGTAPTGLEAAQEALKQISQLQLIASIHNSGQLDTNEYPELARAVELGVINQQQALEGQRYFDFLKFDELEYGFEVKSYYRTLVGDKFMPVAQKPAWLDTFSENLDEAVLGSVDVSEEEQFNAEGDVIVKGGDETGDEKIDNVPPRPDVNMFGGTINQKKWDEQYGETHNPDGTPKGSEKTVTTEGPNKTELEAELATLRKSKKTKKVKARIKEIETILENLEE